VRRTSGPTRYRYITVTVFRVFNTLIMYYMLIVIKDNIKEKREDKKSENKNDKPNLKWSKWTAIASIIYTLFTFWIMIITGYQAKIGRDSLIAVQRAFVDSPKLEQLGIPNAAGQIVATNISPEIQNDGNTPTRNLRFVCSHIFTGNKEISDNQNSFETLMPAPTYNFLAPKAAMVCQGVIVEEAMLEKLTSGEEHLYIFGSLWYNDTLSSTPHITKFCYQFSPFGANNSNFSGHGIRFGLCRQHNCADDECARQ